MQIYISEQVQQSKQNCLRNSTKKVITDIKLPYYSYFILLVYQHHFKKKLFKTAP